MMKSLNVTFEGILEVEWPCGVEIAQMRVRFEAKGAGARYRMIDSVVEREVWNGWTPERRREFIVATFRSVLSRLEIGDVP